MCASTRHIAQPGRHSTGWPTLGSSCARTRRSIGRVWVDIATSGRLSLPLAVTLNYLVDRLKAPVPTSALNRLGAVAANTDAAGRRCSQFGAVSPERRHVVRTAGGTGNPLVRGVRLLRHAFPSVDEVRLAHGVEGPLLGYYLHRFRRFATSVPPSVFRLRPWVDKAVKRILHVPSRPVRSDRAGSSSVPQPVSTDAFPEAVRALETHFPAWVLFFRILLFVIATVMLYVGWTQ